MTASEPQVLYMVLILPSLFGFTLIGEGLNKVARKDAVGWVSVLMGAAFIVVVIGAYLFLAGSL